MNDKIIPVKEIRTQLRMATLFVEFPPEVDSKERYRQVHQLAERKLDEDMKKRKRRKRGKK